MRARHKIKGGVVVCYLKGEIDIDSCGELKKAFKEITDKKPRKVLLNFKEVGYIDSLGISSLINFFKKLKQNEGMVFLSDLSPKLRTLFGITKLENVLKIYETEEEALRDFSGY